MTNIAVGSSPQFTSHSRIVPKFSPRLKPALGLTWAKSVPSLNLWLAPLAPLNQLHLPSRNESEGLEGLNWTDFLPLESCKERTCQILVSRSGFSIDHHHIFIPFLYWYQKSNVYRIWTCPPLFLLFHLYWNNFIFFPKRIQGDPFVIGHSLD